MHEITTPKQARGRSILAAVILCLPALAILLTFLVWAPVLPAEVASHWSDLGSAADGSMSSQGLFVGTLIAAALAAIVSIVVLAVPNVHMRSKRMLVLLFGLVAGAAASVWIIPAGLTVQAGTPDGVVLGFWMIPQLVICLSGIVPAAILPAQPLHLPASTPAALELGETEVGAWSRSVTAMLFLWVALGVVALCVGISVPLLLSDDSSAATFGVVVMVIAALLCASFIRLRVSVDWRGLRVVSLFGIPLKHIPLDQVAVVEATEVHPMDWGGWGYRVMPGRSAVVLRSGPGLVVTTAAGKQFAITIDDPEQPAALLQALAARARVDNA